MDEGLVGETLASLAPAGCDVPKQLVKPTLTAHLEQEKTNLEARLSEVNEAIAALKANPEIERVLNLVGKVKSRY